MILAVCADKGAPGVTTLACALGLVWPGRRLVLEADSSGADLPFWLRGADGRPLRSEPSILSLAADARSDLRDHDLSSYVQETSLGLPVIPGPVAAEGFAAMRALWPGVAARAAAWPGVVLADLGRFQPGSPAVPLVTSATVVVVLGEATAPGLHRLRQRISELVPVVSNVQRPRTPLTAVVVAPSRRAAQAVSDADAVLTAAGSPIRALGALHDDRTAALAIVSGDASLGHQRGRKPGGNPMLKSAAVLAERLIAAWPDLVPRPSRDVSDDGVTSRMPAAVDHSRRAGWWMRDE